jgi:hypothetical protein
MAAAILGAVIGCSAPVAVSGVRDRTVAAERSAALAMTVPVAPAGIRSAVATAYLRFLSVLAQDSRISNDLDPRLGTVATGPELAKDRTVLAVRHLHHLHTVGQPVAHIAAISVDGAQATVRDCRDNAHTSVVDASGRTLDVGMGRLEAIVTLIDEKGTWKVANILYVEGVPC